MLKHFCTGLFGACAYLFAPQLALAQSNAESFPAGPVKLIIPYPPGGVANGVGRMVSERLTSVWKHRVVVDNRPGGHAIIGTNAMAKSKPDGYTFGLIIASQAITPLLYKDLPYDSERDLTPISLIAEYPYLILVNPAFPARNIGDLIKIAKNKPNEVTFASSGNGSGPHLTLELLNLRANIKLAHIPYKGGGLALTDVAGGHVVAFCSSLLSAKPLLSAGKLRVIGVTSTKRFKTLPDVPAVAETLPKFAFTGWIGLVAPTGTPKHAIDNISTNIARYVHEPDAHDRFIALGLEPSGSTPQEFGAFFRSETDKFREIIEKADIRVDR